MRTRITDYKIDLATTGKVKIHIPTPPVSIPSSYTKPITEALKLVIDETTAVVFCSSMQKSKLKSVGESTETGYAYVLEFDAPTNKTIASTDMMTIEFDWGTQIEDVKTIVTAIQSGALTTSDLTTIQTAIIGALRGLNTNANMTELLTLLQYLTTGCTFEQNNDGQDTYTLVVDDSISIEDSNMIA